MPIEYLDDIEEDITEAADTTPVEQPPVAGISEPVAPEPSGEFGGRIEYIEEEPLEIEPPRDNSWDTLRGLEVSMRQVPQLAYGVAGLVGETAEQLTGYGESLRDFGFKGYQDWAQSMEPISKETDDVTVAWQRAKEGDVGALVDWAQYGIGYALGQLGESAAVAVLGGIAGGAAGAAGGPTAIPAAAGGAVVAAAGKQGFKALAQNLVEKAIANQATKIVTKQAQKEGVELTAEQLAKRASQEAIKREAGKQIGSNAAIFANAIGMQLGAIYGSAEEKAREEGRELTGVDLARIWGTGIATGGLEGVVDKFGLDLLKGKFAEALPAGRLAGAAVAAPIGLAGEAATEAVQTVGERFGAGRELLSDEAINEYINASALGGLGGGAIGGVGGFISGNPKENAAAKAKVSSETNKDIAPATAETVARQADAVIAETVQETPEQKVARLQEEATAAAGIELEEEGVGVEPPVTVTPPVETTPEGAVAPVEPVVTPEVAEAPVTATRTIADSIRDKDTFIYNGMRGAVSVENDVTVFRPFGTQEKYEVPVNPNQTIDEIEGIEWARRGQRREGRIEPQPETAAIIESAPVVSQEEVDVEESDFEVPAALVEIEKSQTLNDLADLFDTGESIVSQEGKRETKVSEAPEFYRQVKPDQIDQANRLIDNALRIIDALPISEDQKAAMADPFLLLDQDISNYESNPEYQQYKASIRTEVRPAGEAVALPETEAEVAAGVRELESRSRAEAVRLEREAQARRVAAGQAAFVPAPQIESLSRVIRTEAQPQEFESLVEQGLAEEYNGQQILTQAGFDALPQEQRPRLTPEARKIQIDTGASEAAAEAIIKGLRIGVDQVPPNVRMPEGWTLDGDIYIPPAAQAEAGRVARDEESIKEITTQYGVDNRLATSIFNNQIVEVSSGRWSGPSNWVVEQYGDKFYAIPPATIKNRLAAQGELRRLSMLERAALAGILTEQRLLTETDAKQYIQDASKQGYSADEISAASAAAEATWNERFGGDVNARQVAGEVSPEVVDVAAEEAERAKRPKVTGGTALPASKLFGMTAREALQYLADQNLGAAQTEAEGRPLNLSQQMQRAASILAKLPLRMLDADFIKKARGSNRAYRANEGFVRLPATRRGKEYFEAPETLVHEVGHTLTADAIRKYVFDRAFRRASGNQYLKALDNALANPNTPEQIKRLINLYKQTIDELGITQEYFGAGGLAGTDATISQKKAWNRKKPLINKFTGKKIGWYELYGLANLDEFVAQTWSDLEFQDMLKNIKVQNKPSIYERFVRIIRDLFGFDSDTMAAAVIDASYALAELEAPATGGTVEQRIAGNIQRGRRVVTPSQAAPPPEGTLRPEFRGMSPEAYADYLESAPESERENIDIYENSAGWTVYEGREIISKIKPNSTKFRRISDKYIALPRDWDFVANVDGVPYGLTKEEDPDDENLQVWAFGKIGTNDFVETIYNVGMEQEVMDQMRQDLIEKQAEEPMAPPEAPQEIPTFSEGSPEASTLSTMAASMAKVDAASEAKGPTTYKISEIASIWMDQGGDTRQLQDLISENTNLTPSNAKKVANAIAKQYDIQQSIATAFIETQTGLSVEALPEGVTLPKEVDPDRPRPVMQRLFDVFMGVRVPPVKITVNEKTALKQQIRLKAAANRAAKQEQQRTADEVVEIIKAMELLGPVRPKQVQALAKRAARVIWTSEKSVEAFSEYATKVVENANYDADLREAKDAQKRAKQLSTQKKVAMSPQREVLEDVSKIPVNKLDDPRMFAEAVNYYLRGFKSVLSPDYVVIPDAEMESYLSGAQSETQRNQRDLDREANERLAKKYGIEPDQVNEMMESIDIIKQIEAQENREALENLLTEKAIETQQGLRGYDTDNLRADQRSIVSSMLKVDPKALDPEERQRFIRITNNIIYNNQTNGAEYFVAVAKGQQSAREAAQDSTMVAKNRAWINLLPRFISERMQRGWALELQSIADTFRNAFGKGAMAKMYDAMGMLDLNLGFTKANNTIDEIQEKIAEFHRNLEKKYKAAARNQDGLLAEGVVGFLIQSVPKKDELTSINQRRDLIRQDIANRRRSTTEPDKVAMADRIETILNQIDGDSVEAILDNMKREFPANHESLIWYKDTLLPQYKDFLKSFDENFNDQANNYENPNYLTIGFTSAGPSLAITPEEQSLFYDQVSLRPKQSAYTIKRVDYTEIPKDRTTKRPKEIEFNLRRNVFNGLSDQINKAYTSSGWQRIASFMKTPEAEVVFGGAANKDFFIERLNRLRLSRMRRGSMGSGGAIEKAVDSLSVISRKLGTGIALGGIYQWIKQPPDQLVTAWGSGGRGDLLAKNIAPKTQKLARTLLNKFSIGRRGDASAGYKYINQMEGHQNRLERYFSESKWDQAKEQAGKIADVWMIALKSSDFLAASAAWMTYYEGELNKQDIKIDDWSKEADLIESDPKRRQAAAFAEQMTDIYQGSSDPTSMATFAQSGKTGWENLVKAIFVPFNSFAIQQRMRLYSDARDAINGSKSGVGGLSGTIGGLILFHATKRYVIPAISGAGVGVLYGLMGVDMDEPDEEKQKEEANKNWRQFLADITGNLLVGGTPQLVESQFIDAMNRASYLVSLQLENDSILNEEGEVMSYDQYSKERSPFYRYKSFDNAMSLGMFDIGIGQAEQVALQTKMLATPEEMEMYTPEEQRLLYFSALSEWLYMMRLNDADFARLVGKARRDMMSAAKDREKELQRIRSGR